MDYQAVQDLISNMKKHQQVFQESIDQLTQVVSELNEENNRLRMVNHQLEDELRHYVIEHTETVVEEAPMIEQVTQPISGHDRLRSFYEDGIHVCHELYGKRRQTAEDCLFCQDVLSRLEQG